MSETIHLDESFYIVADTERAGGPPRVLKHGDTFAVFDQYGDIVPAEGSDQGLYYEGTRFLSRFELLLFGRRPLFLSSTVSDDNAVFTVDLTNPDVLQGDTVAIRHGGIHLSRSHVVWDGMWIERIRVANYSLSAIAAPLTMRFAADFADIFEVRGTRRAARGVQLPDACNEDCLLTYRGLDGLERQTRLSWSPRPAQFEAGRATFLITLAPRTTVDIEVSVSCSYRDAPRSRQSFDEALTHVRRERAVHGCGITSSNESFNRWLGRSAADLELLLTQTPHGLYPYAGIPWFSTPFGRDGIITAIELLWAHPQIARGVLAFLAKTQATSRDDARDAQPGKILHEMRAGEMAALGEVPFGRYYGSVDATPLFVVLAHAYYERTADAAFIDRLWPHLVAALHWMAGDGDPDGDGFLEYFRRSDTGLVQQGWKDSFDSVFHADGQLADAPIALCEVQGYAYAAWRGAAALAAMRGEDEARNQWLTRSARLAEDFDRAFWCEELGTYALALDGHKRPCCVRTSNAGHCLWTGIVPPARTTRLAATLMSDVFFAGWGVRTVAEGEARYNPMSYHNGSIWPHDNALIAAGLARCGMTDVANRIAGAMFDLSKAVDLHRLPELICGFDRRGGEYPTLYPVACAPQAWAAGAARLLLQACLGLQIEAGAPRVSFLRPRLPDAIDWLRITNLTIGNARLDLHVERSQHDVGVTVHRRDGNVEIAIVK